MKITDIIRRAGRNLKRSKIRTFLTSSAIAVGGFAIMASFMVGEGARQYLDRVISANMDKQNIAIAKDERFFKINGGAGSEDIHEYDPDSVTNYGSTVKGLNQTDIDKIKQNKNIESVLPSYRLSTKYAEFSLKPDKKFTTRVSVQNPRIKQNITAGKQFNLSDKLGDNEAIMPDSFAKVIGIDKPEKFVGSTITLTIYQPPKAVNPQLIKQTFAREGEQGVRRLTEGKTTKKSLKIVSVSDTKKDKLNSGGNEKGLQVNANVAKEISDFSTAGTDQYQKYVIVYATVKDGIDPEKVKDDLKKQDYHVATAKDLQETLFGLTNTLQYIVLGFGALALIVSIFGIVNTQYISVLERTKQIGLMKALGASRRDIGRLFRYEAAWIGFLGGLLGVLAAWGIGSAANPWISKQLGFGEHSLLIFQADKAVLIVVALMLVAIIAGFLPSRKAAKLDPIEALRTE
ncbi:hypothetical protein CR956_00210 [Candidatus Saccharibacteria bacterium]|nr:MAG: hypothetical protein CR956_00210 [Candidatus Saccharibacteria bacterium]